MEARLGRSVVIVAIIAAAGGLVMRGCARRMERQIAAVRATAVDTASGLSDSARAVELARRAYVIDHEARGETPPAVQITAFFKDSAGYLLELAPTEGAQGTRAVARVSAGGGVELRRRGP
jgi:hypothetical protein